MRPATERPLSEMMTVVLRLSRQSSLSSALDGKQKDRVKEALGVVMTELQKADAPAKKRRRV